MKQRDCEAPLSDVNRVLRTHEPAPRPGAQARIARALAEPAPRRVLPLWALWAPAAGLALAGAVLWLSGEGAVDPRLVSGQVGLPDRPALVEPGARVPVATAVEVVADTELDLDLATVSAHAGTRLRLSTPAARRVRLAVDTGSILARVDRLTGKEGFAVSTPHAHIEVLGTVFTVRVNDEGTWTETREGLVAVKGAGLDAQVRPGESLFVPSEAHLAARTAGALSAADALRRGGDLEAAQAAYGAIAADAHAGLLAEEALVRRALLLETLGRRAPALAALRESGRRFPRGLLASERAAAEARLLAADGDLEGAMGVLDALGPGEEPTLSLLEVRLALAERLLARGEARAARRLTEPLAGRPLPESLARRAAILERAQMKVPAPPDTNGAEPRATSPFEKDPTP